MYAADASLQISVFDHTVKLGSRKEFKFYPWGLSNVTNDPIYSFGDITSKLGHTHIDVLKVRCLTIPLCLLCLRSEYSPSRVSIHL